jgi:hypothetical protein
MKRFKDYLARDGRVTIYPYGKGKQGFEFPREETAIIDMLNELTEQAESSTKIETHLIEELDKLTLVVEAMGERIKELENK